MTIAEDLSWLTVAVGLLLSLGGLRATLYFYKIDKALTGNWVIHGRVNTCRTITIVAFGLTISRAIALVYGPNDWLAAINGLLIIWLLSIPIMLWRNAVAHEGIEIGLPYPETQNQREDREFGEQRRELEVEHRRELEVEHSADNGPLTVSEIEEKRESEESGETLREIEERKPMRPLMVGVAHGLDLLTFLLVISLGVSIDGEWNVLARELMTWGTVGLALLIALKGAAAVAMACMVAWGRYPWFSRVALIPAVGAGILGAVVNLLAYTHFR